MSVRFIAPLTGEPAEWVTIIPEISFGKSDARLRIEQLSSDENDWIRDAIRSYRNSSSDRIICPTRRSDAAVVEVNLSRSSGGNLPARMTSAGLCMALADRFALQYSNMVLKDGSPSNGSTRVLVAATGEFQANGDITKVSGNIGGKLDAVLGAMQKLNADGTSDRAGIFFYPAQNKTDVAYLADKVQALNQANIFVVPVQHFEDCFDHLTRVMTLFTATDQVVHRGVDAQKSKDTTPARKTSMILPLGFAMLIGAAVIAGVTGFGVKDAVPECIEDCDPESWLDRDLCEKLIQTVDATDARQIDKKGMEDDPFERTVYNQCKIFLQS